jgi:hypothetical protein
MMVTRRAGFAKSAYGSKSDVEMIVHQRFAHAAFDSPVGQNLMNVSSRARLTTQKSLAPKT